MEFTNVIYDPLSENTQITRDYIYHTNQPDISNIPLSCSDDQRLVIKLLNYTQSNDTPLSRYFADNFQKCRKPFSEDQKKMD